MIHLMTATILRTIIDISIGNGDANINNSTLYINCVVYTIIHIDNLAPTEIAMVKNPKQ